jgi:AbrB family looped-hinge helix DNA binding protein
MRITTKGQVTIPLDIRERFGFLPETDVEFVVDGDLVILVKASDGRRPTRGERAVAALRSRRPSLQLTTDEIMALTRGEVTAILVDSNVLIDVIEDDAALGRVVQRRAGGGTEAAVVVINAIVYGELSVACRRLRTSRRPSRSTSTGASRSRTPRRSWPAGALSSTAAVVGCAPRRRRTSTSVPMRPSRATGC